MPDPTKITSEDRGTYDWYLLWLAHPIATPKCMFEAIRAGQLIHAPLMAYVSLLSGKWAGGIEALRHYVTGDQLLCECCGKQLQNGGIGHDVNCALYQKAGKVVNNLPDPAKQQLLLQRDQLCIQMEAINQKLAAMDGAIKL